MPELPEVETVRRVLGPQMTGRTMISASIRTPGVIAHPEPEAFIAGIEGKKVNNTRRRGKFLIIGLEDESLLIIHLRMTGCLLIAPEGYPEEAHTHVTIGLDDGKELRFSDTRRFGRLWLIDSGQDACTGMERLGPEPFDNIDASYLQGRLGRSRRKIKQCLMDQSAIAGIGNIYSDEILFSSSIDPRREACTLSADEWRRLAKAIPERLSFFIEKNMITPEEYLETKGRDYRNTPFLQVYGHEGEPCPICGSRLEHTVIAGRGSTFCPICQH